jgi:tetratricopeptide (TPR) repeat protein
MKATLLFFMVLSAVAGLAEQPAQSAPSEPGSHPDAMYYFKEGSRLFLQQKYSSAVEPYRKALDLEKQKRTLSKDYFRVLVDNLGMSYGISGNLTQAKATFEYGLTLDPQYPMFFYNIACVYGEMNKMNESLEQLKLAYKYKANMISGEKLPDPLQDDSFRSFINDKDFVRQVHEMQQ